MPDDSFTPVLPYPRLVGQAQLKTALELAYIAPRIGGVLICGERGTGKSTAVRAFAQMMFDDFPVTLPMNATEDRVVGGWRIDELMHTRAEPQPGLLEEADGRVLYVDEVNLLDDHIINIILDVTSTGVLVVQREGLDQHRQLRFLLIGTMNPEEGSLRPQLLDRFGLMVRVDAEQDQQTRRHVLQTVLAFDEAVYRSSMGEPDPFFSTALREAQAWKASLEQARQNLYTVEVSTEMAGACVALASRFQIEGHRGDYVMLLAARALAAHQGQSSVTLEHLRMVAPLALQHRRAEARELNRILWTAEEEQRLAEPLENV